MLLDEYKNKKLEIFKDSHYDGCINVNSEMDLYNIFSKNGVDLFIDIGSNNGELLKYFKCDKIAFEPDKRNIIKNKNTKIYYNAIYKSNCYKKLYYCDDMTQSSLKYNFMGRYKWVKCKKLDSYINIIKKYKVILIKIDVEGVEPEVLQGMKKILKLNIPIIIIFEYSYKWYLSDKKIDEIFYSLIKNRFIVGRYSVFGIELLTKMFAYYLKNYHYSLMIAYKNINIPKEKYIPIKFGLLEFLKIRDEVTYDFSMIKDKI